MLLGAALIVRDEERCLARCLSSLRDVVDEIVIVDTGSVDGSVAIAESFGATVLHREWDGDFSAARNYGLDHLRSEFVLYIDADEYLVGATRAGVEAGLADGAAHVGYRLKLKARPGFTPYREHRMSGRLAHIRFHGVIHESIVEAIYAAGRADGLQVGTIDLLLEHDGYEDDQSAKHARNLPLLLEQIKKHPTRTYLWDHVGRIHEALGDVAESRAAFARGIALVRKNGVLDSADGLVYADLIFCNANAATPDADLVREATALFPGHAYIQWASALDAFARREYDEVEDHIGKLLTISEDTMAAGALGIKEQIQSEWAFHVRGMARFEQGNFRGAAADFAMAEQADPSVVAYRMKRTIAESRGGR